jgi:hypothetical protein
MKTLSAIVISTCFATLAFGCGDAVSAEGSLDTATLALVEGSPEAIGLLGFLNNPTTTVDVLDHDVPLNRRAARNLIHHRDGFDGVTGTYDDNLFDHLAEVDAVRWVGTSAMASLVNFAFTQNWVPTADDVLGTWDGVVFTVAEAEATLALANGSTEAELDHDLNLDRRAAASIAAAQPIETLSALSGLWFVGGSALGLLKDAAVTAEPLSLDERFAGDLSRYLDEWYAVYGADAEQAGARDLAEAQAAISIDAMEAVMDAEEDPFGYDLSTTHIIVHPALVFPGADTMWFGAYDAATGELIEIGRFE